MNTIRLSAASVEEAVDLAVERLRVPREALQWRIDRSEDEYLLDDRRPPTTTIVAWIKPEYVADQVRDFLQKMVHLMGFAAEVRVQVRNDCIHARMSSPNSSVLIGKDGATLDALQYIVTRMASLGGRVVPPIVVDIEEYRERKVSRLERLAEHTAEKVVDEGCEIALRPMSSGDRKIIHTALKDYPGVKTYSQGPEEERCVVIAPASGSSRSSEEI